MIECPGCLSSSTLSELETHTIGEICYRLHACGFCDLHFWNPRVMPDPSFYETVQVDESKARLFRHALIDYELRPYHREFFVNPPTPGRLLDIGCGDGKFLETALKKGFEVWGLDLDHSAIDVAVQRGLTNVFGCTLDDFSAQNPPLYDVITSFEVLEHQADPSSFMHQLHTMLVVGGFMCGSVPNRRRWKLDQDDRWDSPPHHFTRWTEKSLRIFLSRQGFTDIVISNASFGYKSMSYYGKVAAYFKRRSYRELPEKDIVLYSLEHLEEQKKISGGKTSFLRWAKKAAKGLVLPFIHAETALERLIGKGQTLVFKCRRS